METSPDPAPEGWRAMIVRVGVVLLLAVSATCLALAPLVLPPGYSWLRQTTSEAAAQGLSGAWLTRLGFLLFGFAVMWLATAARQRWGRVGSLLLGAFGVCMVGTAAFSHAPWIAGVPADRVEDALHSVTATAMGFAFAGGVVAAGVRRARASPTDRVVDALAVLCSVAIPLAMSWAVGYAGLLQRGMFLVAYLWYGREALRAA